MPQPPSQSLGDVFREARVGARDVEPLTQYQTDPEWFFADVLGIPRHTVRWSLNEGYQSHQWDGTPDPLATMLKGLVDWQNVGVESATTTGKTFGAAATVLWFLGSFKDSLVITVAPKEDQLKLNLWKEVGKLWPRFARKFPQAEFSNLRIRLRPGKDGWSAHGFVAGVKADEVEGSATKAQGFHAEHMLIVYEEMPGVARAISKAFSNSCRAPHNLQLALGNPDHVLDNLHTFCQGPRTVAVRISAYDHPNIVCDNPSIIPGAVSRQGIEDALALAQNDGGTENRMFKSRVRGIAPLESAEALIRMEWVLRAQERWKAHAAGQNADYLSAVTAVARQWGKPALGVDVANSEDGDQAATAFGFGHICLEVKAERCPDANVYGFKTAKRMETEGVADANVGVDTVGVGAGCYNELARLKHFVRSLNGGASAEYVHGGEEEYLNLRAQMHWTLREDLRLDRVDLPPDMELAKDLVVPKWKPKNGKITVEAKEDIKSILGRSPNKGDAVVYWNFVRDRSAILQPVPRVPRLVAGDPVTTPLQFDQDPTFSESGPEEWVPGSTRSYGV